MMAASAQPEPYREAELSRPSEVDRHAAGPSSRPSIAQPAAPSLPRSSSASDVRLPSIRSLAGLEDPPRPMSQRSMAAVPPSAGSVPRAYGDSKPTSPQYHFHQPPPHRENLPSLSHIVSDGSAYHSAEESSRPTSPPTRQRFPSMHSPPTGPPRSTHHHPFFDLGRKSTSPQAPRRRSDDIARGRMVDQLVDIEEALGTARSLIRDAIQSPDHLYGVEAVIDILDKAGFSLRSLRETRHELRYGSPPTTSSGSGSYDVSRQRQDRVSANHHKGANTIGGIPPYAARFEAPSGSIWSLKTQDPPPAGPPPLPPSAHSHARYRSTDYAAGPRALYEGQSAEPSKDPDFRPPMAVIRTYTSMPSTPAHEHPGQSHEESSYLYAPPSIRNRIAAMQGAQPQPQPDHGPVPHPHLPPSSRQGLPLHHAAPPPGIIGVGPPPYPSMAPHVPIYDDAAADHGLNGDQASKYKKRSRAPAPSACKNCGTHETPEWRRGPDGARTLCNACGLHFAKLSKRKPNSDVSGEEHLAENGPFVHSS